MLESINWKNTDYPKMPEWIYDLISHDENKRIQIWWIFDHSGLNSLSSFSPLFASVLVELAQDDSIVYKGNLLALLAELGDSAQSQLEGEKNSLALEVIQIIIEAKADYLNIIRLNQHGWQDALKILMSINRYIYDIIPELATIIDHNHEVDKQIAYYNTLRLLIKWDTDNKQNHIHYLLKKLDVEENQDVRHAIALALLHIQEGTISDIVIKLLQDFFRSNEMIQYLDDILSLNTEIAVNIIINSSYFPATYHFDIFNRIATLLSIIFDDGDMNVHALYSGHSGIKERHFSQGMAIRNHKQIKPVTRLNKIQKQVLQAILQHKQLWDIKTNLYALYGLPPTLEEIEKWVLSQS